MIQTDTRMAAALLAAGMSPLADRVVTGYGARRHTSRAPDLDRPPKVPDPLPPTWAPGPNSVTVMGLEPGLCKFPVGDADGVDQLHCGNPTHLHRDEPYCPDCAQRVLTKGATINPKVLH